jgi:MFS family permease
VTDDGDLRPPEHPRRFVIFANISGVLLMTSIDYTSVATALLQITEQLGSRGVNWTSLIVTAYALTRVVVTPVYGRLGEKFGVRRMLIGSVGLFTLSSLACGLSVNLPMLVAMRVMQSIGGAGFQPMATAIVTEVFPRNRDRAVGLFTTIMPVGAVLGPVLGGLIVHYWSWQGIFLINVPIGLIAFFVSLRTLPDVARKPSRTFDIGGTLLLCSGLLCVTLAITLLGDADAFVIWVAVPLFAAGVVLLWRMFRRSDRPDAILPRRLLVGGGFGAINVLNFFHGLAAVGLSTIIPLYAQTRYELSPLDSGTLLTARAIGMGAMSGAATFAMRRTGYRMPMLIGYVIGGGSIIMLGFAPFGTLSSYTWLAIWALAFGLSFGMATPSANNASLQLVPSDAAMIAGLRGTLRPLGAVMAVAVVTSVINRSSDPAGSGAISFMVIGALLLAAGAILVPRVPEHKAGW